MTDSSSSNRKGCNIKVHESEQGNVTEINISWHEAW